MVQFKTIMTVLSELCRVHCPLPADELAGLDVDASVIGGALAVKPFDVLDLVKF